MANDAMKKVLEMDAANQRNRIKAEALIAEARKQGADPVQIAEACVRQELPEEWVARVLANLHMKLTSVGDGTFAIEPMEYPNECGAYPAHTAQTIVEAVRGYVAKTEKA